MNYGSMALASPWTVGNYSLQDGSSSIPFSTTTTIDIIESKHSSNSNSNVSSRSKGNPLDLLGTKKYKSSTTKKVTESCSLPAGLAPKCSMVSTSDNNLKKKLNGLDSIKGNSWGTGGDKWGIPPTKSNLTTVNDPEICKKMFGDNEQLYINLSKIPSNNNNKTNAEHSYKAKEEQSRNVLHSHIYLDNVDN